MVAVLACREIGNIAQFLEERRQRGGRLALEPLVDEATWLTCYSHPQQWLFNCIEDLLPQAKCKTATSKTSKPSHVTEGQMRDFYDIALTLLETVDAEMNQELESVLHETQDFQPAIFDNNELPPALYFALYVAIPCLLVHGATPHQLLVHVAKGGPRGMEAIEHLVRLDSRIIQHPIVRRWVRHSKHGSRSERERLLGKWQNAKPFRKLAIPGVLVRVSAILLSVADLLQDDLTIPKLREIIDQSPLPDGASDYLLARTNDDFGRVVRTFRAKMLFPSKADETIFDTIREIREMLA